MDSLYKKYLTITLLLILLGTANVVSAISGACSSHRGVNCSMGASSLGNVVCNDGWESSTYYYDTDECQTSFKISCPMPVLFGCLEDFQYTQDQDLCTQEQANADTYCKSMQTSAGRNGGVIPSCSDLPYKPSTSACAQAIACKQQIDNNKLANQKFNDCMNTQLQEEQQMNDDKLRLSEALLKQSQDQLKQLNLNESCGTFGVYNQNTNQCGCTDGYVYANGKCNLTQDQIDILINQADTEVPTSTPTYKMYQGIAKPSPKLVTPPTKKPKPSLDNIFDTSTSNTKNASTTALQGFIIGSSSTTPSTTTTQQTTQSQKTPFWGNVKNFLKHFNPFSWFKR